MRPRLLSLLALLLVVPALVLGPPVASSAAVPATVSGTVVVPPGYDVRDVRVVVVPDGSNYLFVPSAQWAEADGTFSITDLSAGDYRIVFLTYNRDLVGCNGNPAWWTGLGQPANGTCTGANVFSADVEVLPLEYGDDVDLGDVPVLSTIGESTIDGSLVAPAGYSAAGVNVDVWLRGSGAYNNGVEGWARPGNVPTQTVGADGRFSFSLINGYWSEYALRFTDPSGEFAFSFTSGELDENTVGANGSDFGAGSVGLLDLRTIARPISRPGLKLKLPAVYTGGSVSIEGVPEWGRTLTAVSDVVWSPDVGTDYQWYNGGILIPGATGPTLTTNRGDQGFQAEISVRAIPAGDYASKSVPVESDVVTILNTTPFNRSAPVVSGTSRVGQPLSSTTGSWTPTAPVYAYGYQWLRDGAPIAGATAATYVPTAADAGRQVSVRTSAYRGADCEFCQPWFTGPGFATSTATQVRFTPTVTMTAKQKKATQGAGKKKAKVVIKIRVATGGPAATGVVVVKDGKKTIGTLTLRRGKATLRKLLKLGKHKLSASYAQTATVAAGSARTKIKVT